jgi:lipid-binding SYLF domain-containing protein
MKMISAGAGLGVGVKDYRVIFVFSNDEPLTQFLDSGWSDSAQTVVAAKASKMGTAYSLAVEVAPGVWVYQITKNGLALQLTLQGTKCCKDDDLNKKVAVDREAGPWQSKQSSPRCQLRSSHGEPLPIY